MRPIILAFAVLLASLAGQAQQVPTLQSQLQAVAAQHHGKVALFAENLQTHEAVAFSPDEPVPTASVIKLAILYEALEQVRAGKVHLDDKLTLTTADQVPGSGVLRQFDTPLALTLKDVLSLMIELSDNTATNLAIDHLGLANINARMAELGLKNTYLYKKVFKPVAPSVAVPVDQPRFGLGKTTPREMASLMTRFVTCELGHPATAMDANLCAVALHMLQSQFYRDGIPRYLETMLGATGDSIANKSGSLDAVRNDVAAIATKRGIDIIAIFTYENADHSWIADNEGDATTAKLARAIIAAWSPEGLTAWPVPPQKNCGGR